MYRTSDIYFTEHIMDEDESLLPYTDFQSRSMPVQQYGDYREQYTYGPSAIYGAFFFNRSRFSQLYTIQYQKIDDLISQIGGFVQSIMVVAAAIVGFYNQEYYTIELANQIYDFDIQTQNNNNNPGGGDGKGDAMSKSQFQKGQIESKLNKGGMQKQGDFTLNKTFQAPLNDSNKKGDIFTLTKMLTRKNIGGKHKTNIQNQSTQIKNQETEKVQQKNHIHFQFNDISPTTGINDKISPSALQTKQLIIPKDDNYVKNNITINLITDKNNVEIKRKTTEHTNNINKEELNRLLSWTPHLSPKPKIETNKKGQKRVGSALCQLSNCKTSTNDVLKYSTISPLSLTQIDNRTKFYRDNQCSTRQLTSSDDTNQMKLINQSPQLFSLSPQSALQNPILLNLPERQSEVAKQSLIYFDQSSIEPESINDPDLSLDASVQPNSNQFQMQTSSIQRKADKAIFRTIQPINQNLDRQKIFRVKSFSNFNNINKQEVSSSSFKSLRDAKDQGTGLDIQQMSEITQRNFLNAYREEMRKDYMSKQLERVLQKRQKLKISFKYFVFRLTCGKLFCTKENLLIRRASDFLQKDVDIIVILNKLKELEKLKCLLLDPNQLTLFNYFPKPLLKVDKNKNIVFEKEEKIRRQKQFEESCKAMKIEPAQVSIVKKAKDKFKNILKNSRKTTDEDPFSHTNLLNEKNQQNDYQKLYKAYEKISNQTQKNRMDQILVKTLGEETMKVFQQSLQMKFGSDKLQNLITRSTSKSQAQQKKNK